MLGTAALLILQCRTQSNDEVVLGPRTDAWGLSAESVTLSNGATLWHTHGKGFNDHFLHHVMWFVSILDILGDQRISHVSAIEVAHTYLTKLEVLSKQKINGLNFVFFFQEYLKTFNF